VTKELGLDPSRTEDAQRRIGTKAKAILAGGLVLGVGAAITLAAWTDEEWAIGEFGAGNFGIQGSTDNASWGDHVDEDSAAPLSFGVAAENLAPGDEVYAPFAVRLADDSNYAADVTVAQTGGLTGLSASFVETAAFGCDDGSDFDGGTPVAGNGFTLDETKDTRYLCFKVTADDDLAQGTSGDFLWEFAAESGAELTAP